MLYVYFGSDAENVREEARTFIDDFRKKGAEVHRITTQDFSHDALRDLAGSAGLFGETSVVVLDALHDDREIFELMMTSLEMLSDSPNTFVVIEGTLSASEKKLLASHAKTCVEVKKDSPDVSFNIFALTDALATRDKKMLWLLLTEAWRIGKTDEEIVGTLFWQLKTLRLAAKTKSAEEAGLKPFVYQKAKRASGAFADGELEKLSTALLNLYHGGHAGKLDLHTALERWCLGI